MTATLVISCGAADTRAALLADDRAAGFWFGPARGDEATDDYPRAGRRYTGRVTRVDGNLGAFVDIGAGQPGFAPVKKSLSLAEGALIEATVRAEPRRAKGAVLDIIGPAAGDVGPRGDPDAAIAAAQSLTGYGDVITDSADAMRALAGAGISAACDDAGSLWRRFGLDAELENAFSRRVALPGGGALTIEETEALAAIDVDAAALSGASSQRQREKLADAAAREALRQVRLRNLAGHVVIDFPPLGSTRAQAAFEERARALTKEIDGVSAAGFSRSGLFTFRRRRVAASLIDRHGCDAGGDLVSGRDLSVRFCAAEAIRALEAAMEVERSSRFALICGAGLGAFIAARPLWTERLVARYGARFAIRIDAAMKERRFDLAQQ